MLVQSTPSQRLQNAAHRERMAKFWPAKVIIPPTRRTIARLPISNAQLQEAWEILESKNINLHGLTSGEAIKHAVAHYYDISLADLCSGRRFGHLIKPRHVAMYLMRYHTTLSMPAIGRSLGDRDHATILHGVRKIEGYLPTDKTLAGEIADLVKMIGA